MARMFSKIDYKIMLDDAVKKATKSEVIKKKKEQKKESEKKSMPQKSNNKSETTTVRNDAFADLREIVNMKKQKAIANELDELIHEQEERKKMREKIKEGNGQKKETSVDPLKLLLAQNPDKIKEMSLEDAIKLSMMLNPKGGSDPLLSMMLLGMNNNNNNGNEITNKILTLMIEKMFSNDEKSSSSEDNLMKFLIAQNMQMQQLFLSMLTKKDEKPKENHLLKELVDLIKNQTNLEKSILMDKLRELEIRSQGSDPLGEAKRVIDYMKTFKTLFAPQTTTPELLEHERKMKELEFEQQKQLKEEELRDRRMENIAQMINNSIGTFAKVLSEPAAQAVKSKLDEMAQKPAQPRITASDVPKEVLQKEIDLGDLNLEDELDLQEAPSFSNKKRFTVLEKDSEV